jgi:NAD(P)H-hydrate repair Nnr-like enzyme with NAD(P)H-hydrate dehydratase domain
VIAGLLARGAEPAQAAVWSVYLHGGAGRVMTARMGKVGFLAREMLVEIPALLAQFD